MGTEDGPDVSTPGAALVSPPGSSCPRHAGSGPMVPVPPWVVVGGSTARARLRGCGAARRTGVGLVQPRVRERPADVLLGVRVVLHVHRQRADRVEVAVRREDLVDTPVAVPVVDDLLATRLGGGAGGRRAGEQGQHDERDQRGRNEESTEGGVGHEYRRTWRAESSRLPWVGDQGRVNDV